MADRHDPNGSNAAANAAGRADVRALDERKLCDPFLDRLPVTGASMTVLGESGNQSTICSTDAVASRIEELQFELGEGPHWQALRTGKPVLVPNVGLASWDSWPMFGAAILDTGIGAVFSFPMVMGAATIGVVDLYRSEAGDLSPGDVIAARGLAWSVAEAALQAAARSADNEARSTITEAPEMRREVHQATGIILVQLKTTATEAFMRLRAHAYSTGRSVEEVALDVVTKRVDFRQFTD